MKPGWIVLALAFGGCSLSPSADFVKALAEDPATASINIVYPYGTIMWCRTNPMQNAKVTCTNSGVSVDQTIQAPTNAVIPMTITPQFTITPAPSGPVVVPQSPPRNVPRTPIVPKAPMP